MQASIIPTTVSQYDPATMHDMLYRMLDGWGVTRPESPHYNFWQSVLENPSMQLAVLVIAIRENQCIGVGFANWRPYFSDDCRNVVFMVDDDYRRQGVGKALKQGMDEAFREHGLTRQVIALLPENMNIVPFLASCGFIEDESLRTLRFSWDGASYSYQSVPGISLHRFDRKHLDREIAEQLAEFYNRAYANELMHTCLTGNQIMNLAETDDMWLLYARDEATGRIVAYTECSNSPMFSGVAVLRPWWGTGLAEWISGYAMDLYREMGFSELWSIARTQNTASIRLQKRMGWYENGQCLHYIADVNP